ncbi:hypothetical protein BDV36DRAFT_289807 [Aspergillus pseudocaelatus]|uniref:Myb-like domain-containing protein n=1 Tax=Aspergillus pseudocaelatus TaxID=1825620 RepID=A0ABQ6VZ21_9EURO|nr:hypothetical protein BDV36DRAFT_289807 [Aspergillus pseudocaelatus]
MAENPGVAEDKSIPSCQPYQSNAPSGPECPASLAIPSVDRPESYPSVAVVVPVPPWARGKVTRATTRVAAVTCKKRLRNRGSGNDYRDPEVSIPDATRQRPKEKPKSKMKPLHASPMLAQAPPVDTSGKQRPYTSEENALLVRLKERERMSWAEIAAHFPERSASSLQVHYSTKLRHKATTQARRLRNRR